MKANRCPATGIEGIFRLSGSEKRIKELKHIFDSPDRYGKGLVWEGYTVHDAANVLRRYLNDLPEPVVPLDLYESFRQPLRGATKQAVGDTDGPQFIENFDEKGAIVKYQQLITELPPLNRQLLLYILDLLAVFAAKSDENRMNSQNLAAIFQPGMLSHPNHAMAPEEYRLNQCVIIFLIENQDHFLIGMQGTAADETTKKEVESGKALPALPAPATPNLQKSSGIGRSLSNASAGAESVRRDGKVRRNRSVSSKNSNSNSRQDGTSTPDSPALTATPSSGLARSNTLPSKKSPALMGKKFKRSEQNQSTHLEPLTQVRPIEELGPAESSIPPVTRITADPTVIPTTTAGRSQERLLDVSNEETTPSKERNFPILGQGLPTDPADRRQPNKLKKKRIPGSLNPSAHSSNASLGLAHSNIPPANVEIINNPTGDTVEKGEQAAVERISEPQQGDTSKNPQTAHTAVAAAETQIAATQKKSPPASTHSGRQDGSDIDQAKESLPNSPQLDSPEKKKRWKMSRSSRDEHEAPGSPHSKTHLYENIVVSNSSINSASNRPRKSFSTDGPDQGTGGTDHDARETKDGKDESRGPMHWIKSKYREARNKSPPGEREKSVIGSNISGRRRSGDKLDDKASQGSNQSQTAQTQTAQPQTAQFQTAQPPTVQTPIIQSQSAQPQTTQTPTVQSQIAQPQSAQLQSAQPQSAQPESAQPQIAPQVPLNNAAQSPPSEHSIQPVV